MIPKPIPRFAGFNIALTARDDGGSQDGLSRIGVKLDTPDKCNWACPYCYVTEAPHTANDEYPPRVSESPSIHFGNSDWTERMIGWISQALDLGVRCVSLNGTYEPLMSPSCLPIIAFCRSRGISVTLVTNGSLLAPDVIATLLDYGIGIVTKMNVPLVNPEDSSYTEMAHIQAALAGKPHDAIRLYEKQKQIVRDLMNAGFNHATKEGITRLGIESVITNLNVHALPRLIAQLRSWNIYAHIEIPKLQGSLKNNAALAVPKAQLASFFQAVLQQDITMGYTAWDPMPPYVAGSCYENLFRVDIHADGSVTPCPGIPIALGNLHTNSLRELLRHPLLQLVRNLRTAIQGDCRTCHLFQLQRCYGGCRGTVYQTLRAHGFAETDCLTASDPSCPYVHTVLDSGASADLFDASHAKCRLQNTPQVSQEID